MPDMIKPQITQPLEKTVFLLVAIILVAVAKVLGTDCIIMNIFGIPCPGCGITRAVVAAIKLKFDVAASYNIMFWSVPFLLGYFYTDGKLFPSGRFNNVFFIVICIGFVVNWIFKLWR